MINDNFNLYASCIPTKGFKRSAICDLQENELFLIPNELFDILEKYNGKTVREIKDEYGNRFDDVIDEYFQFLESKNLIFYYKNSNQFPKVNMDWEVPFTINNAIIDIDLNSNYKNAKILNQLNDINCKNLQIRIFYAIEIDYFEWLFNFLENTKSSISSVEIITKWDENYKIQNLKILISKFARIRSLIVYGAPVNEEVRMEGPENVHFFFVKENVYSNSCCGIINPSYFSINNKNYIESLSHNTCLNGKISISAEGLVKNCPSMTESFGNIENVTLKNVLNLSGFKKYWNITKDFIDVCKDCEFRHVCTDCRAYTQRTHFKAGIDLSKPLKCGYNPYTNEWSKWSANPLKKNAIEYYGLDEQVKKN